MVVGDVIVLRYIIMAVGITITTTMVAIGAGVAAISGPGSSVG